MAELLAGIKPGDDVAAYMAVPGPAHYLLRTVERVTPSGRIVLVDGSRFRPDGRGIGDDDDFRIRPVDDEVRRSLRRQEAIELLYQVVRGRKTLPLEALERIAEIVREATRTDMATAEGANVTEGG